MNPLKTQVVLEWAERNYHDIKDDDYLSKIEKDEALAYFDKAKCLHDNACVMFIVNEN